MSSSLETELQKPTSRRGFFRKVSEATGVAAITTIALNSIARAEGEPPAPQVSANAGLNAIITEATMNLDKAANLPYSRLNDLLTPLAIPAEAEELFFKPIEAAVPGQVLPDDVKEKAKWTQPFAGSDVLHFTSPNGSNENPREDNIVIIDHRSKEVKFVAVELMAVPTTPDSKNILIEDLINEYGTPEDSNKDSDGFEYRVWASQGLTAKSYQFREGVNITGLWLYKPTDVDQYRKSWGDELFPSLNLYYREPSAPVIGGATGK